jgi:hypothetical protein
MAPMGILEPVLWVTHLCLSTYFVISAPRGQIMLFICINQGNGSIRSIQLGTGGVAQVVESLSGKHWP